MSKYGIQVGLKEGDTFILTKQKGAEHVEITLLIKSSAKCYGCIADGKRKLCNSLPRDCFNDFIYVEVK